MGARSTLVMAGGLGLAGAWAGPVQNNDHGQSPGINEARAVTIDNAGSVIAAGYIENTGTGKDFAVIKYAASDHGTELWRTVLNGSEDRDDMALAVAVDPAGDVIAAGYLTNREAGRDFTVVKLSGSNGAEQWRRIINGSAARDDVALAVTVDAAGDVIAAGYLREADTGQNFAVVKLSQSDGAERWRRVLAGTEKSADAARAVTVNAAGEVYAAGSFTNPGTGQAFLVVRLAPADGTELWRQEVYGTAPGPHEASAITLSHEGHVVAAGYVTNAATGGRLHGDQAFGYQRGRALAPGNQRHRQSMGSGPGGRR